MARSLRIAMFVGAFPVISETFIVRQITGLLDLGHEVDIYANSRPESDGPVHPEVNNYHLVERTTYIDAPAETGEAEMPVFPIMGRTWPPGSETPIHNSMRLARALPKFCRSFVRSPRLTFQALCSAEYGYQAASLSTLYRLAKLCSKTKHYDVLHAHFGPVGNSFRFARRLWRAPLCVSFHGYDFSTLPREEGPRIYDKLFATADAVTVNSRYTRSQLEKLACPAELLHLLPVGLDPREFAFHERSRAAGEPVRILTVGRLVPIKGHEYVIRAVARLREKMADVRYDIVGDGPLRSALQSLTYELKLEGAVKLHGALHRASIKRLMDQAHLFVLGSVSIEGDQEGQGLALQEAQAAGLPVVATRHGALPEGMLPEESGFLVPERDVEALSERLNYLATHPQLWPILGRKGRSFVEEHYDIRELNQRLLQLYEEIIGQYLNERRV